MYNLEFIYQYADLNFLPPEIERNRLFNVSFDIDNGDTKLYILDKSQRFAYKVSKSGISKQYSAAAPEFLACQQRLNVFLGKQLNYRQITIDAVEGNSYYVYLNDTKRTEYQRFINSYCSRFNISLELLLSKAGHINNRTFNDLNECFKSKGISMIRVPLDAPESKLYAQPFLYSRGYPLNQRTEAFMLKLHQCTIEQLPTLLKHSWVVTDMSQDRTLVVTQNHELLHVAE